MQYVEADKISVKTLARADWGARDAVRKIVRGYREAGEPSWPYAASLCSGGAFLATGLGIAAYKVWPDYMFSEVGAVLSAEGVMVLLGLAIWCASIFDLPHFLVGPQIRRKQNQMRELLYYDLRTHYGGLWQNLCEINDPLARDLREILGPFEAELRGISSEDLLRELRSA